MEINASESFHPTKYWHRLEDGRVQCDLCPRTCKLKNGQRGLCFVRAAHEDEIVLTSYGRSSGFCIDPIEKKPLNHFLPGTPVLSFGTAGCNLACKFCQNWDISKSRQMDSLADQASPEQLADAAKQTGCRSIAFTYNDPIIFMEYAMDVATACRENSIKTVAVTAGYINEQAREEFFSCIDAANVDLKAFSNDFYRKITGSDLHTVLETLLYLKHETNVWFEITNLIIPNENDSEQEIHNMCTWIVENLGLDVPIHFSAFHPDWKMLDHSRTPKDTLIRARQIALDYDIHYIYTGNVHHIEGDTTYCPNCNAALIVRDWYELKQWNLDLGHCVKCKQSIPGMFEKQPGNWGSKRQRVFMNSF